MKLYFLRHGLAVQSEQWDGDDRGRPLTEEGVRKMAREAKALARLDLGLDRILTSPLVRARQTAELVAGELGLADGCVEDERLAPGFAVPDLVRILQAYPRSAALMLVGHEPDFSRVIGRLIGGGNVECRKGGIARVDLPDPASPFGTLVWLIPPKALTP